MSHISSLTDFNQELTVLFKNIDKPSVEKIINGFYQLSNVNKFFSFDKTSSIKIQTIKDDISDFLLYPSFRGLYYEQSKVSSNSIIFLLYMGQIYIALKHFDQGITFYQEALSQQKNVSTNDLLMADLFHKVGYFYEQQTAYGEALKYYEAALTIRKELSYVENNLVVAESYNSLAILYTYMEEYLLAKAYIDKAVAMREKILPLDNPLLQTSYYNQQFLEKECRPKVDYFTLLLKFFQKKFYRLFPN